MSSSSGANLEKYRIPLHEIRRVTRNFSTETLIGDGGFGLVHIRQLSEEWQNRTVAIKRLNRDGYQGDNEFCNELEMVSSFHHQNIIAFIGYCDEDNEKIIVYDYATNGSLDHHLQKRDKMRSLTWAQRLKICLGAAKGLKYLHSGLGEHNRVIHRDVKSANILLDDNLEAKICDFGLSRFGARNQEHTQLLTKAAGTRFYMDPLYAERSRLTKESDVYSFGVVMFEMSSGTLVYHEKCFGDDAKAQFLLDVVRSCYDDDKNVDQPDKVIDPMLRDRINMKSFHTFNKIAHECITLKLEQRPPMARIIRKIEQALNIHKNHYESPSTIPTRSLDSCQIPRGEIWWETQRFYEGIRIAKYPHGQVYRGQLHGRRTMAFTRMYLNSYDSDNEFKKAVGMISSFEHQNISRFIGYSHEGKERIVVHEHALNGSLADYLETQQKNNLRKLTWAERLRIFLGAARGLQYLHLALGEDNEAKWGNIECTNIFLDEFMEAKVSFFGLSKQESVCENPHDYKPDMYAFGVIVFELLSGRRAHDLNTYAEPENQVDLLQKYYQNNELDQFIDDFIRDQIDSRCLKILKEVAYRCIKRGNQMHRMRWQDRGIGAAGGSRDLRPPFTMNEVVERIEDAADFERNEN